MRTLTRRCNLRIKSSSVSRPFSWTSRVLNENVEARHRASKQETSNVMAMDQLMRTIRENSDPKYYSVMPMRSSMLWSETLMNSVMKSNVPSPEPTVSTSSVSLQERSMADSFCEFTLPFSSDPTLLEEYTNASGGIRTGKLMENLDSLAGSITYKHLLGPVAKLGSIQERGFYVVTAGIDRLDMLSSISSSRDLRLSGQVIYTGRSSMEIAVKIESLYPDGTAETALLGRFSMVCRNAVTHKARPVNPLNVTTSSEQQLHDIGESLKIQRQDLNNRSLDRVPPSSEEAAQLHSFYLSMGHDDVLKKPNSVWMSETKLEKTMLMFPQERNVHQKIFGGYLMRLAYELGFANSTLFTRSQVRFLSLDGLSFARPVPIGSILRLTSQIIHVAPPNTVHVGVIANVVDVETGKEETTNEFRFTWMAYDHDGTHKFVRDVVPKTYTEAMYWLEGKRALDVGEVIRRMRETSRGT